MKIHFPGMDPYLEHPALWPDVHNSLIAALRDNIAPRVAPRYYVALESRTYSIVPDDIGFVGRPDISVIREPGAAYEATPGSVGVLDVDIPMPDEVNEYYLAIYTTEPRELVTVLELLSPSNKRPGEGRNLYARKRHNILVSMTNFVEVDLLRAGEPLPPTGDKRRRDYAIFVSRGWTRPRAQLFTFDLPQPIPQVPLPLLQGDEEPVVELNFVLHELYERARFDLQIDYDKAPEPPLSTEMADWANSLPRSTP